MNRKVWLLNFSVVVFPKTWRRTMSEQPKYGPSKKQFNAAIKLGKTLIKGSFRLAKAQTEWMATLNSIDHSIEFKGLKITPKGVKIGELKASTSYKKK